MRFVIFKGIDGRRRAVPADNIALIEDEMDTMDDDGNGTKSIVTLFSGAQFIVDGGAYDLMKILQDVGERQN